jgi:geranylgeranyl diphosphate synthase type I
MSSSSPGPLDRADLRQRVQKCLNAFVGGQQHMLDAVSAELSPLTETLADLLSSGKRLRPAFCYWGFRGAGGTDSDEVVTAAAALELFQACAIVHDDVMDGSETRRGQPAVHRRFAALHRTEGWTGDPAGFGTGAAILLGDLALSWSDQMLSTCGLPAEALRRGRQVYDEMRTELMGGQYLDLLEQARGGGSVERALRVARYKSAKYTIEKPLHLGAVLAGAEQDVLDGYSGYGLPLGEAFQLRDDVLGVFGDPSQTGKPAGDDLREGKRTALVALALESASPAQSAAVRRHLGDPHLADDGVATLRTVLRDTGALATVEQMVEQLMDEALQALEAAPVDSGARQVLHELAVAATARSV